MTNCWLHLFLCRRFEKKNIASPPQYHLFSCTWHAIYSVTSLRWPQSPSSVYSSMSINLNPKYFKSFYARGQTKYAILQRNRRKKTVREVNKFWISTKKNRKILWKSLKLITDRAIYTVSDCRAIFYVKTLAGFRIIDPATWTLG